MKYKILVILNRPKWENADPFFVTMKYFAERTPLEIEYEYMDGTMPVQLKNWGVTFKDGREIYATDGLRAWLELNNIDGTKYNSIVFIYDLSKTDWYQDQFGAVAHITHWNAHQGASIIEIATLERWGPDDVYRVLTHELFHAFHQHTRLQGITTVDTMDMFDGEFDVLSPSGNRARNIRELSTHWDSVVSQPFLLLSLLSLKLKFFQLLLKMKFTKPKYLWDSKSNIRHSIRMMCDNAGLSVVDKNIITACIQQESGFIPSAIGKKNTNGTTDYGLCQYNDGKNSRGQAYWIGEGAVFKDIAEVLSDPEKNVRVMISEYKAGHISWWSSYKTGAYKKWL